MASKTARCKSIEHLKWIDALSNLGPIFTHSHAYKSQLAHFLEISFAYRLWFLFVKWHNQKVWIQEKNTALCRLSQQMFDLNTILPCVFRIISQHNDHCCSPFFLLAIFSCLIWEKNAKKDGGQCYKCKNASSWIRQCFGPTQNATFWFFCTPHREKGDARNRFCVESIRHQSDNMLVDKYNVCVYLSKSGM